MPFYYTDIRHRVPPSYDDILRATKTATVLSDADAPKQSRHFYQETPLSPQISHLSLEGGRGREVPGCQEVEDNWESRKWQVIVDKLVKKGGTEYTTEAFRKKFK
jgi:hypothetical protein